MLAIYIIISYQKIKKTIHIDINYILLSHIEKLRNNSCGCRL